MYKIYRLYIVLLKDTQLLLSRIRDIDAVAEEMASKVEKMKRDMASRKEVKN